MARTKKQSPTKVESIRHKDKRANIPTEELRDFVADEELAPKTMLYPRDPSLDPQLVWQGKDEQDREDLAVPVVPIYIQEKIHPQALIDDLLARAARPAGDRVAEEAAAYQIELFGEFNGGPHNFEQKVDFYHHEQNWTNRLILGDSLLVMTSLAEKEGLKGKVQMMYFDPPYGIKFGSNWQVSTRKRDVKDGKAEDATPQATADPAHARDSAPARRIESTEALMFLVSALDRLKNLSEAEVKNIATETALKGTTGIDLDSPEKIHSISALGNERLSGLELICLMHAAFQRIHAGTDVGVDFSHIWPAAQMMHAARNP